MSEPRWISREIVNAIHDKQIQIHGGTPGLRENGMPEPALARPLQQWSYTQPPPDLCALAATYAFGLIKNHAFLDGNKRTAHMVYRLFLAKNGLNLVASREDKYINMIYLASSKHTEESFADWLRSATEPA